MPSWNKCFFKALLILFLCSFGSCNVIQKDRQDVIAGKHCNLECDHPKITTGDYIHWYRMIPGQAPVFLISGFQDKADNRFNISFGKDRKSSVLLIEEVKPEDSAVYLCAQGAYNTGFNKLIFGKGTKLDVCPRTERTIPSVYQLKADKSEGDLPKSVCLVTDFPTPNTTLTVDEKPIKLDDKSVLDQSTSDVWRYSAVVWDDENPSKDLSCKVKYDGKDVPQEKKIIDETDTTCTSLVINERFRTNPGMNTLSMSVFGMRMLTAKAVIFNLIITLRLWSS